MNIRLRADGRLHELARMAALFVAILVLAGCVRPPSSRETPQGPTEVSRISSAMSSVKTFGFTSTLTDNYTVVEASAALTDPRLWEGRTDADLARSVAYVTMNTTDLTYPLAPRFRWEMYLEDGWQYYSQKTPGGGTGNQWSRRKLETNNPLFLNSAQMAPLVDLLQSAASLSTVGSDVVDGLVCDIIEFSPTANATSDWVLSQDRQSGGPSLSWWRTTAGRSKEIYSNGFTAGSARLWIDRNSSRILKVDLTLHFSVRPGNARRSDTGLVVPGNETDLGFDEIQRDFHSEIHFFDYGRRASIVPPQEALSAPTRY